VRILWLVAAVVAVSVGGLLALAGGPGGGAGPRAAALPQPPDGDAPPGAPPHWIPSEEWVMQHWLPYDEARLTALLRTTRAGLWRHLRDDRRTLGSLAARRGWRDPSALAAALVAPRARTVSPATARELRARALRTLTQGHMAQHILFHSLHQDAVPDRAKEVFGVSSVDEFQRLRRLDVSPLQIARMNGRSRASVQRLATEALHERARAGVRGGDLSDRQARVLLDRQLRQLPRWLSEAHYNGPPRTDDRTGALLEPPVPAWAAPAITGDGRDVVMEAYEPKLELALARGEISVLSAAPGRAARRVSPASSAARTGPVSAYNPVVSADGRRVAFELSAGNRNFAKRYGDTTVVVQDRRTGRARRVGRRAGTAYAPALSGDGSVVALQVAQAADARTRVYAGRVRGDALRPLRGRPPSAAPGRAPTLTSLRSPATAGGWRTPRSRTGRAGRGPSSTCTTAGPGAPCSRAARRAATAPSPTPRRGRRG
jgi:hypothetical protein